MVILSQIIICLQNVATVSKSKVILKGLESINWECVLSITGKKDYSWMEDNTLALHDEEFQ